MFGLIFITLSRVYIGCGRGGGKFTSAHKMQEHNAFSIIFAKIHHYHRGENFMGDFWDVLGGFGDFCDIFGGFLGFLRRQLRLKKRSCRSFLS